VVPGAASDVRKISASIAHVLAAGFIGKTDRCRPMPRLGGETDEGAQVEGGQCESPEKSRDVDERSETLQVSAVALSCSEHENLHWISVLPAKSNA
jgi:hypothetical protein